jgi:hypothetical protein
MSDIQHKILFVCIHNSTVASWPKPSLKNTVVNTFLWKDESNGLTGLSQTLRLSPAPLKRSCDGLAKSATKLKRK